MMGRSHLMLAGAAYASLAARPLVTPLGTLHAPALSGGPFPLESDQFALSLCVAAVAGLAPDIDKVGSTAARSLGIVTGVLSWGIERTLGHRGGLHSLVGAALGFALGELLGRLLGVAGLGALVAFGWCVHLLTDAWTVRGVPLFWPVTTAPVKLPPRLSTGTIAEAIVLILALGVLFLYASAGLFWRPDVTT